MRWLCVLSLVGAIAAVVTAPSACPAHTFTCDDGSCIPEDWVGDGEADCDDRSDETGHMVANRTKEADPFDSVVTTSPQNQPASKVRQQTTEEPKDCPYEHQLRVDECAEPVLLFLHDVNAIYFENSSLLSDKETQTRVEKGCTLMQEYTICTKGASAACSADEGVQSWREVEMYACQLLIPAVREHRQCFGRPRHTVSLIYFRFDPLASPFCRLVTSVTQDVNCIQKHHEGCTEAALEMLEPILEESQQITSSLRCRSPSDLPAHEPTHESTPEDTEEPTTEMRETTTETTPIMTTTASTAPRTPHLVTLPSTTRRTMGPVVQETLAPHEATTVHMPSENLGRELKINMSDAVNAFYYIYDVCSSDYSKSPFARVAAKLCMKQDEIAKYSDCYQNTLEKQKCTARDVKTECEALEAFNANLDCSIVTMNDVCEVEAQNTVIELQEAVNDILIERKCFEQKEKAAEPKTPADPNEFHLDTKMTHCTDEQENGALACLVELVEINKQLAQFQNLNFLLEIATENSTAVANICKLYDKYEKCLNASVFFDNKRCAFASPLNTLARIGLAPICSIDSGPLLSSHRDCLVKLASQAGAESSNCQSGLSGLGNTVNMMLQGIHGEALLCKSFYLIRDTFACGEKAVEQQCDAKALEDLSTLKKQMSQIGEEEGCPKVQPANLDEIIARPVKRPTPPPIPLPKRPDTAPVARPLNTAAPVNGSAQVVDMSASQETNGQASSAPPPAPASPPQPQPQAVCAPEQQKKFEECVRPLTAFQPHPLSVIKIPRQIDEACEEFEKFKTCVSDVQCRPLWATGMTAMFSYACGEGSEGYKKVRQCLRKISSEDTVKECVTTFSRGAPTQACLSANALLTCAIAPIQTECGEETSDWVVKYVTKFATAIDPRCKLASQLPIGKVIGVGCTAEEEAVIEHCAAPLNDIGARMEELFQGGLQAMIKNVNSLAPVFAGGCNLTDEFRQCASFLFTGRTPCVVSSCMIHAGDGICDQPDPTKAIDDNLSCVFAQVQEPSFAKCVRSILTTVKQFTLNSFRNILPKFIDCTEEIVMAKCGETPIKVLRAMSSPDICPIGPAPIVPVNKPERVEPQVPTCTPEKKQAFDQCTQPFYTRYRMLPVTLINEMDNLDQVCSDVSVMDGCSISTRICSTNEQTALKKMIEQLCASRQAYDHYKICLKTVASSPQGSSCTSEFMSSTPGSRCSSLQNAASCIAKQVRDECGEDALTYSFAAMNDYAKMVDSRCWIDKPSVAIATGCTEQDMVAYLSCESSIDPFSFRPVSIIGDGSKWDEMCTAFATSYKPCVEKMKCRFEPVSSANMQLFDGICNKPLTLRDQKSFGKCLSDYTNSEKGQQCIAAMAAVDPMAADAPGKMCTVLNSVLQCAGEDIEKQCGYDALLHVYEQHTLWAQAYNKSCVVQSPEPKSVPSNTLDQSKDVEPQHVTKDETTPVGVLQKDTTPLVIGVDVFDVTTSAEETTTTSEMQETTTTHPKDITTMTAGVANSMLSALLVLFIALRVF
ncbi:unnamed protein product [Cylicocyclus nassatus]|uniref:T20D4.11-like domain-containing protein n=1 Tax=Cylicocyclus nassatus TaxID=53992 RepID=A0AA36GRL0_CYLNA|nr:unnamed protein product [Cylicocyclus nassatus]